MYKKTLPVVNGKLVCGHQKILGKRDGGRIVRQLRKLNGFPTRKSSVKVQCFVCGFKSNGFRNF